MSPSAVTTSASTRLSTVSPCLRMSQPMPPPRREATYAGVAHDAARGAQTVCLRLVVDVAPQGAALDVCDALDGIDGDARIAERSITMPSSRPRCRPRCGLPLVQRSRGRAGRGRTAPLRSRRRCRCSGRSIEGADRRCRSIRAGVVVGIVVGSDHVAPEPGDLHVRWCGHRSSSGRSAHRNIGRYRGEVSYLDFVVRNLDFTAVGKRGTLRS